MFIWHSQVAKQMSKHHTYVFTTSLYLTKLLTIYCKNLYTPLFFVCLFVCLFIWQSQLAKKMSKETCLCFRNLHVLNLATYLQPFVETFIPLFVYLFVCLFGTIKLQSKCLNKLWIYRSHWAFIFNMKIFMGF